MYIKKINPDSIKKKEKRNLLNFFWKFIQLFLFCIVIVSFVFIHELGHVLTSYSLGGRLLSVELGFGALRFYTMEPTEYASNIVLMMGSVFALFISSTLGALGFYFRQTWLLIASLFYFFVEFLYWTCSPVFRFGDAYILNNYQVNYVFSLIMLFLSIIVFTICLKIYFTYIEIKYHKRK
jgi:hypothetical protein